MRTPFIVTAFLLLLVLTNAETFERAKLRGLSKKMPTSAFFQIVKGSQFGKTLLNLLTLKLKTSDGQLSQLLEVLEELQDRLEAQQNQDNQSFTDQSGPLNTLIAAEQADVTSATDNLADFKAQLDDNQNGLSQANAQLQSLQQEQASINENLQSLQQVRASDKDAFNQRANNQEVLIAGLSKTIQLFQEQSNNAQLNQDAVNQILELLNSLVTAFQASISSDKAADDQADADLAAYSAPRTARLQEIASSLSDLTAAISQFQTTISQLQSRADSEQSRLDAAQQLLTQYQQQLQDITKKYNNNSATRSEQLRLLSAVHLKLTQNPDDIQQVLNDA